MKQKGLNWFFRTVAFVALVGALVLSAPARQPREAVDVNGIAAEVTQAAGKNLAKGAVKGLKEAVFGIEGDD
jgi:hypothetical protein